MVIHHLFNLLFLKLHLQAASNVILKKKKKEKTKTFKAKGTLDFKLEIKQLKTD